MITVFASLAFAQAEIVINKIQNPGVEYLQNHKVVGIAHTED